VARDARNSRRLSRCRTCATTLPDEQHTAKLTALADAIVASPAEPRTAFVMRFVERLDYAAIVQRLGITGGEARTQLHAALR